MMAQRDQRFDIEVDHLHLVVEIAVNVPPLPAKTCVIDQNINLKTRIRNLADQLRCAVGGAQIHCEHMGLYSMLGFNLGCERIQLILGTRCENDIAAPLCMIAGEFSTNP
jgi:hypothetical protein